MTRPSQTAAPRARRAASLRAGFTLVELLAVISIIALLTAASLGSLFRARAFAKRAKAEAELRELVNAWGQYYTTYWEWPSSLNGAREVEVTSSLLEPLTDPANGDNKYGIVFLNYSGTGTYKDPWGSAYRLTFSGRDSSGGNRHTIVQEATVALPERVTVPVGEGN